MNAKQVYSALILGIRDYFKKNSFQKAVIGLSGGIDSSVSAYLAAKALGNKNVTAILMPDSGVTSKESISDAKSIIKRLKIKHYNLPINQVVQYFENVNRQLNFKKNIYAIANVKARARMMLLYYFANLSNCLVIGTSDKSEIALGYATKYGDNAADILVIGDLWKTEVIEMGKFLNIPSQILRKKPSAELIAGRTAEKELGAPYEILDKILRMHLEEEKSMDEIIKAGFSEKTVKNALERIKLNEHKRRAAIIIKAF